MTNIVRTSCNHVSSQAKHVKISKQALQRFVSGFDSEVLRQLRLRSNIDEGIHFRGDVALTAQYLLVLDTLNFCFWPGIPSPKLMVTDLSRRGAGVPSPLRRTESTRSCTPPRSVSFPQRVLLDDPTAFDARRLQTVEGKDVRRWLNWARPLPLEEERTRLVREIGHGLEPFQGSAANLIRSAGCSVFKLISILTREFPGFRDQAVYNGEQVFLYKRAQIFAGDVWGSFRGTDLGEFHDIHELTMFPDYRVPQLLLHLGVLEYSPSLLKALSNRELLEAGGSMEVEIRAASVMAVEAIKDEIKVTFGEDVVPMSIQLDWWLWEKAELENLDDALQHRTLTLFY